MGAYLPILRGDISDIRCGVENMLTPNSKSVMEQCQKIDAAIQAMGKWATFGAEIELQFIPDPSAKSCDLDLTPAHFYDYILEHLQDRSYQEETWAKGEVNHPSMCKDPILVLSHCNGRYEADGQGEEIFEIRTAPAGEKEAVERYWQTLQAIGNVAAAEGYLAMILSTHISTAVCDRDSPSKGVIGVMSFFSENVNERNCAKNITAAIQHNLNAVQPLQIDAGLEDGVVVQEAFPLSKDATTTIHEYRLELRHPLVGIVDPRIDVLAVLDGVHQALAGTVASRAMKRMKGCRFLYWGGYSCVSEALNNVAMQDAHTGRIVLPASFDIGARPKQLDERRAEFVQLATGSSEEIEGGYVDILFREIVAGLRLVNTRMVAGDDASYHFARELAEVNVSAWEFAHRALPYVVHDSPESHIKRRANMLRSSTVRRILGGIVHALTPALQSVAIRRQLIDETMIVVTNEEWLP